MDQAAPRTDSVFFEARYRAFLETIAQLRPKLHRYCARMTGSVFDGEDVVQDALFQAYRKLDMLEEGRPLEPWLFRIAHNRCIDFLRRRGVRTGAEAASLDPEEALEPSEPVGKDLGRAVEHLVATLPPKERACVLLKDVFDYSLSEIAELVDSTVGGVKAALSRGRAKLVTQPPGVPVARAANEKDAELLRLYVERFNQRDWDGLRELIAADARLAVPDGFAGRLVDSPYFSTYERLPTEWRLAPGQVDGEPVVLVLHRGADGWAPGAVVRLNVANGRITEIADYFRCPWLLAAAASVVVADAAP